MLLALAAVPVVISAVLCLIAPRVGRLLPPSSAVKVLAPVSLAAALTTGFCLSVLAFNGLADLGVIARLGHWAPSVDPDDGSPPPAGGILLGLLVAALLITALHYVLRTAVDAVRTAAACRQLQATTKQLVVIEDDIADAFAVPGVRGRIVVTSGMLRALDRSEREVLIAHERAHLAHHHQLLIQVANLAASANPLLIPVAAQVRILTERWADEEAAMAVQDRHLAARAVAKAALARSSSTRRLRGRPATTLGAATTGVTERVQALTRPRPLPRPRFAGVLAGLALAGLAASALLAHTTENKFEHAAAVLSIHHRTAHTTPGTTSESGDGVR